MATVAGWLLRWPWRTILAGHNWGCDIVHTITYSTAVTALRVVAS